jgi:hypothetical protein
MALPAVVQNFATMRGRVLLGWMSRDVAVRFLTTDVYFPENITPEAAERTWRVYRDRVEGLQRNVAAPERLELSHTEKQHAHRFQSYLRTLGPTTVTEVVKIDLSRTVTHQLTVVTERSETYANRVRGNSWFHEALPITQPPDAQINTVVNMNGSNTTATIDIPHGEFALFPVQTTQFSGFSVQQFQRYISVVDGGDRLLLKAGYHRSYARVLSMLPTAMVPTAVVALERNTTGPAVNQAAAGGVIVDDADFGPFGRRAAFFGDFFTSGLFMDVNLRKKRYQLQIQSNWVALDF